MTRDETVKFLDWLKVALPNGAPVVDDELVKRWHQAFATVALADLREPATELVERWTERRWPTAAELNAERRRLDEVREIRAARAALDNAERGLFRFGEAGRRG